MKTRNATKGRPAKPAYQERLVNVSDHFACMSMRRDRKRKNSRLNEISPAIPQGTPKRLFQFGSPITDPHWTRPSEAHIDDSPEVSREL